MIRHHVAQDLLSAEAAPLYLGAGMPAERHAASLSGPVETHSGAQAGNSTASPHPFAYYASPLSTVLLLAALIIALSAFVKLHRETLAPSGVRARYRAFVGSPLLRSAYSRYCCKKFLTRRPASSGLRA